MAAVGLEEKYDAVKQLIAVGKERVANHPRQHPDEQHLLHAKAHEEEWHKNHEDDFRHLTIALLGYCARQFQFVQKWVCEVVIEGERDGDEQ